MELGEVSQAVADIVKRDTGLDVSGYMHTIDLSAVRHILNNHSNEATEKGRGQLPVTDADIEAIPQLIASAEKVVTGAKNPRGQEMIGYVARAVDGTILYIEDARVGRERLATLSMRKYPAARDFGSIAETLLSNARSDGGADVNITDLPRDTTYQQEPLSGAVYDQSLPDIPDVSREAFKAMSGGDAVALSRQHGDVLIVTALAAFFSPVVTETRRKAWDGQASPRFLAARKRCRS